MNKKIVYQQQMILDQSGFPIQCLGNIFDGDQLSGKSAIDIFPFIESIYPNLLQLSAEAFPVIYPIVHGNHPLLPGYYEFRFERLSPSTIQWIIIDVSQMYEALLRQKQSE